MKTRNTMVSLLLLSAVCVTPAYANFFSNPRANTMLNVGSAPSPTPEQLRAIGDSDYASALPRRHGDNLEYMEGRSVFGAHGQQLGYVLAVDNDANQIELQTATGIGITVSASLIGQSNGRLVAPTMSQADVMAMVKEQSGRVLSLNVFLADEPMVSLAGMEGKAVFGVGGERLGYVLAVDGHARKIELQTRNGIGVAVPVNLIMEKGRRLVAPALSRAEVVAMAKEQTGRTVALNIELRNKGG